MAMSESSSLLALSDQHSCHLAIVCTRSPQIPLAPDQTSICSGCKSKWRTQCNVFKRAIMTVGGVFALCVSFLYFFVLMFLFLLYLLYYCFFIFFHLYIYSFFTFMFIFIEANTHTFFSETYEYFLKS